MVVEHLRRSDDGDPLAPDRAAERAVRLLRVQPDPDDGEAVALGRGQRVAQAVDAVVEAVVVRHRRDIDARAAECREGGRGCAEGELLRRGRCPARSRRSRGSPPRDPPGGRPARWGRACRTDRRRAATRGRPRSARRRRRPGRPACRSAAASSCADRLEPVGAAWSSPSTTAPTSIATRQAGEDDAEHELCKARHGATIARSSLRPRKRPRQGLGPCARARRCYFGRFFCLAIAPARRSAVMNMCA